MPLPAGKGSPGARATDAFARGFAALRRGDPARAREILAELEGMTGGSKNDEVAGILRDELRGALLAGDGKTEEAIGLLNAAGGREERMPYGFGPPDPVKPARELLGEVLLAAGRKAEAAEAFRAELARAPKRRLSLAGLASASD
jgi:predicted Zn-dependent protease